MKNQYQGQGAAMKMMTTGAGLLLLSAGIFLLPAAYMFWRIKTLGI
jgi:hypothetical protein